MNFTESIYAWSGILAFVVAALNTFVIWILMPGKAVEKRRIEEDKKRDQILEYLKSHDRRIQALESHDEHQPTISDLHKLSEQVATLATKVEGVSHSVNRMDDYLRSAKK